MKKYKMSKTSTIWLVVISVILIVVYVLLIVFEKQFSLSASTSDKNYIKVLTTLDVIKNIILVGVSVFLSSFVSSSLIEKENLNKTYYNNIIDGMLFNDNFYKYIEKDTQKLLLDGLENNLYPCNNETKKEMLQKIREKLLAGNEEFYYEDCQATVSCEILADKIVKNIKRIIKIRSYAGDVKIHKFKFAATMLENIPGCTCFEIKKIILNDKELEHNIDYSVERSDVKNSLHKKGGYDIKYACESKKPIKIYQKQTTTIEVVYTTIVKKSDIVFTLRVKEHCKKFSLKFKIVNTTKYNIFTDAFGFLDDAKKTLNSDDSNDISIEFNDWIYKGDGVSLSFQEK